MSRSGAVAFSAPSLHGLQEQLGGEQSPAFTLAPIHALAAVEVAAAAELTLCASARHLAAARAAHLRGASMLVTPELAPRLGSDRLWVHANAAWVFACLLERVATLPPAQVADDAVLESGVVVLPGVRIGARVRLGVGTVVGRPGFGFAAAPDGSLHPIPHLGGVLIEDDVWIGAYCTIDAGVLLPTRIGADSKLDSHVHVGHNVELGRRVRVAAQVGLAGSVRVGDDVMLGGQAGVADHVRIGVGARIAAKAGVIGDVPAGATYAGYPAVERQRWLRGHARLYRSRA